MQSYYKFSTMQYKILKCFIVMLLTLQRNTLLFKNQTIFYRNSIKKQLCTYIEQKKLPCLAGSFFKLLSETYFTFSLSASDINFFKANVRS